MAQNKSPDSDDLNAQVATLREDLASITETLSDIVKTQKAGLSDAAHKRLNEVRARGADALSDAQAQMHAANAQARDFVRDKPELSLGLAAALGFVVGILTSSRR